MNTGSRPRPAAGCRRWLLLLGLAMAGAPRAWAEDGVHGTWTGSYVCGQGATALTLVLRPGAAGNELDGLFHFHSPTGNPGVPEGCFTMAGSFGGPNREVKLFAGRWLRRPFGYVTVDLAGRLGPSGDRLDGQVIGPLCRRFELRRVSPDPASVPAACLRDGAIAVLR